ncbi:uncharacterized protein IL334_006417 [Kwoniella shivajii]|uniref:PPM-type phosphatase domain-containing protein n=1 Tax=Kwoniella shivajii TaxID=564305 RepID=A0ABZ1D5W3_9TREE|nr:hypothetical protein IL334_006417 [Kwoniella shivajii]
MNNTASLPKLPLAQPPMIIVTQTSHILLATCGLLLCFAVPFLVYNAATMTRLVRSIPACLRQQAVNEEKSNENLTPTADTNMKVAKSSDPEWTPSSTKEGGKIFIRTVKRDAVQAKYKKNIRTHILHDQDHFDKESTRTPVKRFGNPVSHFHNIILPTTSPGDDRWAADILNYDGLLELANNGRNPLPPFYEDTMTSSDNSSEEVLQPKEANATDMKDKVGKEPVFFWHKWRLVKQHLGEYHKATTITDIVKGDASSDVSMFSVFDGHSGDGVSDLLRRTLHGCLAYALGKALEDKQERISKSDESHGDSNFGVQTILKPKVFANVISQTFLAVDRDIVNTPLLISNPALDMDCGQDRSSAANTDLSTLLTLCNILPGASCALTVIMDAPARRVYIANCGDSRAVAGWWNKKEQTWRCDVLTVDQNGDNPEECTRIDSEHPEHERGTIMVDKGDGVRVFGALHPTRTFGDHIYKAPAKQWRELHKDFCQSNPDQDWGHINAKGRSTPPYVTAKPEVAWRDLDADEAEELRFIILATDGLWGRLSSQEACQLVSANLTHAKQGDVEKAKLSELIPLSFCTSEPKHHDPAGKLNVDGRWIFEDQNSATHLLRNAFGGSDRQLRKQILSLGQPGVKHMRDDTTIT